MQQNKQPTSSPSLAMKTLALPHVGSANALGQLALVGQHASKLLRCKDTPTKAGFVKQCVQDGILDTKYLNLLGQGHDTSALDILTTDAVYAKGQRVGGMLDSLATASLQDQLKALLTQQEMGRADIASQFALLLQLNEITPDEINSYMADGRSNTSALGNYLASHLEKITFEACSATDFSLSLAPVRGDDDDIALPTDLRIAWGLYYVIAPHELQYPHGDDNHSVLKRDLIDTVIAATQCLVLNFLSPHDLFHGYIGFEDADAIREALNDDAPTVEAIAQFLQDCGSLDDIGDLFPGFFHAHLNSGDLDDDTERNKAIHAWAVDMHHLLAMRQKTPRQPLPAHLTSPLDKPALVAYLRQRLADAPADWPTDDSESLDTLHEWTEWLASRVENDLPYLSQEYLDGAEPDDFSMGGIGLEQTIIVLPGCCPELELTLVEMLHEEAMQVSSETITTIRYDEQSDMATFLDATRTIATLINFISKL